MPNLYIQEPNNCVAVREAGPAYGNKFLTDISPSDQPSSGAWGIVLMPPPQTWPEYPFYKTPAVNKENCAVFISGWPEKTDPFTQEDLLYSEDEQVQELIFRIKTSFFIPYSERLANRFVTLFKDAKEEDPACLGISAGSLRYFYDFFQLHTNLKYPTISLTPEFVIFKPNDRHPERKIRISGITTTDFLMETVVPYGVWDWISE